MGIFFRKFREFGQNRENKFSKFRMGTKSAPDKEYTWIRDVSTPVEPLTSVDDYKIEWDLIELDRQLLTT